MHQYSCPQCKTVLKRQEPVPAGKKIKCPKCESIFAPPEASASGSKPAGAKGVKAKIEDDWDRNPYAVTEEKEEDEEARKVERQRAAAGVVQDRFKKSKRGPAQAKVIGPAGWLTAAGVLMGIAYMVLFVIAIFPLVFKGYYMDSPAYKKMSPAEFQAAWEGILLIRIIMIVAACIGFVYSFIVTIGAYKMRTLESYGWAMTGAVMATLSVWFIVGIWCIITMRDKAVIDGFAEEPPPPLP